MSKRVKKGHDVIGSNGLMVNILVTIQCSVKKQKNKTFQAIIQLHDSGKEGDRLLACLTFGLILNK